jgi:ribonuclease P protein component
MGKRFGLQKKEKLKSRKAIGQLFEARQRFSLAPLQVWYRFKQNEDDDPPVQVGVSCSKKQFKKAVDRNRVKRLLREAYRLQKTHFGDMVQHQGKLAQVFFIYTAANLPDYKLISETMAKCLRQLEKKLRHESVL